MNEIAPVKLIETSHYPQVYKNVVKAMRVHEDTQIGPIDYRLSQDKFRDRHGEIRTASLDMDDMGRIERTLTVINCSPVELDRWHELEIMKGDFYYWCLQIKRMLKLHYPTTKLTEDCAAAVREFNHKNRPIPSNYKGVSVPAYFPPDNYFDGMIYHHSIDKSVLANKGQLYLPVVKVKRGKALMDED